MTVPEKNDQISQLSLGYGLFGPGSSSKPHSLLSMSVMKWEETLHKKRERSVYFFIPFIEVPDGTINPQSTQEY